MEPLAKSLGVSVMELMNGEQIVNRNTSCNVLRSKFFVCPICGNLLTSMGDAVISCCGITLPPLEAEETDEEHRICVEQVEDEQFLSVRHPMTKEHFISFLAYASADRFQLVKLYPEGNAETRFRLQGRGVLYAFCNRHGLFRRRIP